MTGTGSRTCGDDPKADLMLEEARHRARNLVSLAVSLASQSLRGLEDDPRVEMLMGRLVALDAVARIGCEVEGDFCLVGSVVSSVMGRIDDPADPRAVIQGDEIQIASRWAHLVAMVVHELAANSIRHGALGAGGRVDLQWRVEYVGGNCRLLMCWTESGGRAFSCDVPSGFGTRMIRDLVRSNRRCDARLSPTDDGLVYDLVIDMPSGDFRRPRL